MLNAFRHPLYSKLCKHNRLVPIKLELLSIFGCMLTLVTKNNLTENTDAPPLVVRSLILIVMHFTVASSGQLFLTNFLYLFPFLTYILLSILLLNYFSIFFSLFSCYFAAKLPIFSVTLLVTSHLSVVLLSYFWVTDFFGILQVKLSKLIIRHVTMMDGDSFSKISSTAPCKFYQWHSVALANFFPCCA